MTPLIQEAVAEIIRDNPGYPIDNLKWFDIKDITPTTGSHFDRINPDVMECHLPFPKIMLVTQDVNLNRVAILVAEEYDLPMKDGNLVQTWIHYRNERYTAPTPICIYKAKPDEELGVAVRFIDAEKKSYIPVDSIGEKEKNCVVTSLKLIDIFLEHLQSNKISYYEPQRRSNHAKRLRQKKVPFYDWKTVVIEPPKPTRDHQGGTHASPRSHERRGHYRTMKKSGKRVWVKQCRVGDPANGTVFHDYKVKDTK